MIGSRIGSKFSLYGSKIGSVSDDEGGSSAPSWSVDATSLKAVPANSTEWTNFISAKGLTGVTVPNSLWLCQETSSNLADSIGSLILIAANSPTYSNVVSGWSRLGVGTVAAGTSKFAAAAGSGPNPATTSSLWVFFIATPSSAASGQTLLSAGGGAAASDMSGFISTGTGVPRVRCANVFVNGASNTFSTVQPWALKYDRTGGNAALYTGQEKIIGTYSTLVTDGPKGIGATSSSASAGASYLYGFMFSGTPAELTDATVKALLTAMGFAIPWS